MAEYQNIKSEILALYNKGTMPSAFLLSMPNNLEIMPILCEISQEILGKVAITEHPDIMQISLANIEQYLDSETKATGKIIPIAAIRQIEKFLRKTPTIANHKIVIIENMADIELNSMNALLKIVEEPPSYAIFFMVSYHGSKILPTIKSRCYKININSQQVQIDNKELYAKAESLLLDRNHKEIYQIKMAISEDNSLYYKFKDYLIHAINHKLKTDYQDKNSLINYYTEIEKMSNLSKLQLPEELLFMKLIAIFD